ncbi:hypothetical protein Rcae01_01529 [Novipirellula caenicola]|uniref:Uncharacterized protein n=1 Tax=Novipirellula caenicola TaxID=1536901 RepID=A0ABP9VLK0_9BACT
MVKFFFVNANPSSKPLAINVSAVLYLSFINGSLVGDTVRSCKYGHASAVMRQGSRLIVSASVAAKPDVCLLFVGRLIYPLVCL